MAVPDPVDYRMGLHILAFHISTDCSSSLSIRNIPKVMLCFIIHCVALLAGLRSSDCYIILLHYPDSEL